MKGDDYTSFDGICLTDTFQLGENGNVGALFSEVFPNNSMRVQQQKIAPIRVIVGNPPYSVGQKSANDNAQNESYPHLDLRVDETYGKKSSANLKKSLYDSYVKAFRWASDRLNENNDNGGVIGFVTNGGWLDGNALDGMRKCLEEEFTSIYVFNLRGNQRTSGELSRKEGGKIFGSGSRAPIAVTILVKNPKAENEKAEIFYHDIGDYLTREDKLKIVRDFKSCMSKKFSDVITVLKPNDKGDWINQRNGNFEILIKISSEKNNMDKEKDKFFTIKVIGAGSNRDVWVYNYSSEVLNKNIYTMLAFYNNQRTKYHEAVKKNPTLLVADFIDTNTEKISWTRGLRQYIAKNTEIIYDSNYITEGAYRPFTKSNLYYDKNIIESAGIFDKIFPTSKQKNLLICVSGTSGTKEMSVLITDKIADLHYNGDTQCFPLYYYEENTTEAMSLFDTDTTSKYTRKDGITDFILGQVHKLYGSKVTKEDIFYYVYGFLHLPSYREEFAADLKKSLPRIMLVDEPKKFWQLSKAGRELADIHLNYEHQPYPTEVFVEGESSGNFKVQKMKFKSKEDKSVLIYNKDITISNIPAKAHEYIVNGRSPLEWIIDRYQIKQDKASGIINDPNKWGEEHGNNRYILDLILSCITVAVRTVEIVESLPKVKF